MHVMQAKSVSAEQAVQYVHSNTLSPSEAKEMQFDKGFREDTEKYVQTLDQDSMWEKFWNSDRPPKNLDQAALAMKKYTIAAFARTGNREVAKPAGQRDYAAVHEMVQGHSLYNAGKSYSELFVSPEVNVDEALGAYLSAEGSNIFGEGFDSDNIQVSMQPASNTLTIMPLDEEGFPLPGLSNAGRPLAIEDLADWFNTSITGEVAKTEFERQQGFREQRQIDQGDEMDYLLGILEPEVRSITGKEVTGSEDDISVVNSLLGKFGSSIIEASKNFISHMATGNTDAAMESAKKVQELTGMQIKEDVNGASEELRPIGEALNRLIKDSIN